MKKKLCWTVVAVVLAFALTACGQPHFDWIDFVQFGRIQYIAVDYGVGAVGRALVDADLGPEFAQVQFKQAEPHVFGHECCQDGDAAFLDAGTPVYIVKGYKPEFRLAAHREGRLVLYEADTNPNAKTGADLLDIGGKVRYIGVNSAQDGVTELAAIADPGQVAALAEMVLSARVDQNRLGQQGTQYFIAFHLEDDTIVTRAYWPDTGELHRGILLPPEFRTAVEQRLNAVTQPTPEPTLTINWITPLPAPIHSLRLKGQVAYTILLDQTHIYWMVDGNFGHIFRYPLAGGEVETIATSQFADGNLDMYRPIRTGDWLIFLDSRTFDDRVWVLHALNLTDQSDNVVTQGNGSTVMRGLAADGDWVAWALLEESASCTGTDAQAVLAVHNLKSGEQRELDRACADEYMWLWPGLSGNRLVAAGSDGLHLFDLTSGQRTTLTTDVFCEPTISDSWIIWTIAECGEFDTTDVVYNLQSGERRIVHHGFGEPVVRHRQAGRWLYWYPPEPLTVYDLETDRMLIVTTPGENEIIRDVAIYDNMIAWARDLDPSTATVHDSVLEWRTLP